MLIALRHTGPHFHALVCHSLPSFTRLIELVFVIGAILPVLNLPCQAQQIRPTQSEESSKREAWRKSMKKTPLPKSGCFTASYPSTRWQEVTCTTAPNVPYPPANGAKPQTVGNGNDNTANVTSGLLSSAEGSFPTVTGLTSANSYSLQLNSNTFYNTPSCSGAANPSQCRGWQQFVYSESASQVFMQYWLINWGTTCSSGWKTFTQNGTIDCWKNSSAASVPGQSFINLPYLTLTGAAAGGTDTAMLGTSSGDLSAVGQDSALNLEQYWTDAEFNVFGDGNGSQVNFNSGSTFVVQTSVDNGTTNPPACGTAGFTGETNNLNLVQPCCPYGGASPSIQFMESNASGATATCGPNGLEGNFAATPYVMSDDQWSPLGGFNQYDVTLGDSTPGATIYYSLYACGSGYSSGSVSSGGGFSAYIPNYCSLTGSLYATAPGYTQSQTVWVTF